MKHLAQPLLLAASLVLPCLPASAEYLRCKNESINVGDLRSAVLQRCGEPVMKDSFCKPVDTTSVQSGTPGVVVVQPCIRVEEWTYNPGRGQFMTTLQIDAGKVTVIKYGDRVQ